VWTGSKAVIYGGQNLTTDALDNGSIYDPTANTWTSIPTVGAPSARTAALGVWVPAVGSRPGYVFIHGGRNPASVYLADAYGFNPETGIWTTLSSYNGPSARAWHFGAWTGNRVAVWGGMGSANAFIGGLFNPD
jgi:hypothetical protein